MTILDRFHYIQHTCIPELVALPTVTDLSSHSRLTTCNTLFITFNNSQSLLHEPCHACGQLIHAWQSLANYSCIHTPQPMLIKEHTLSIYPGTTVPDAFHSYQLCFQRMSPSLAAPFPSLDPPHPLHPPPQHVHWGRVCPEHLLVCLQMAVL